MALIQNVAVLGATGPLGKTLVSALLAAGFQVTCVTRPDSDHVFPDRVIAKSARYTDIRALTTAFENQDAIVEAFNPAAAVYQASIVEAALAAGVQHIVTPDFSGNTFNRNVSELLIFDTKRRAQRHLESVVAASGNRLSWYAIVVGPWYDWTIEKGLFWIDRQRRVITRYGSGNQRYSVSRLALSGEALVAVLRDPERYRNRAAYFASHTVSTKQLIAIIDDMGLQGWSVVDASLDGYFEEAKRLWEQDTENGVENRLASKAYEMFATIALLDEDNRYGSDFSDKVKFGWDEGEDALRENLKKLLSE
ncbi:hypothetical protein FDECE_12188 [Fusarium decemcellulare]|nr:hypothetical protein FDECE_12188 [Fusarium decemcellulare]